MSIFTLGSNIASLRAQRELSKSTDLLTRSSEKLSSGLRINRASDDAAGLAISLDLNAKARIYSQGVRNLNDGISLLSIAEGAGSELKSILIRIKELAEQSSNGTYSSTQRRALDNEGQQLRNEFNRIVSTTSFNGVNPLTGLSGVQIQAGENAVAGQELSLNISSIALSDSGTFKAQQSFAGGDQAKWIGADDFNRDGNVDLVTASLNDDAINVALGNGDGTFKAITSFYGGDNAYYVLTNDVNNDSLADIISVSAVTNRAHVMLGNGDGTFKASVSYATNGSPRALVVYDVNGDGRKDIASASVSGDCIDVLLGNGDGSFSARVTYAAGDQAFSIATADLNRDGITDIITGSFGDSKINVLFGNSGGSFKAPVAYDGLGSPYQVQAEDLNSDGIVDIVAAFHGQDAALVLLGNSDGSFKAGVSFNTIDGATGILIGDANSDGIKDLYVGSYSVDALTILLGNGDGTYRSPVSYAAGDGTWGLVKGDFNGDGVFDIATASSNDDSIVVLLGNGSTSLGGFSLRTQDEARAAMSAIDDAFNRVIARLGDIGSYESRLHTATNNLKQLGENYQTAKSRIIDVDVAEETATFVRAQILQQTGIAILSQANQIPNLILSLLT